MKDEFLKGLLFQLNDATKPVDAADRNLIARAFSNSTQGADARPVASIVEWIEETCAAYCIPKPFAIIEALQGAASAPREKT